MNNERTASAIGTTTGHAQIHSEAFDMSLYQELFSGTNQRWISYERRWKVYLS